MIDYEYKDLFWTDSTNVQITIKSTDDSVTVTNSEMYDTGIELHESICSEDSLVFGCCESNYIKFKMADTNASLKDKLIDVSYVLNNHTENPFILGRYKVVSDKPSGDKDYRNVTAYDAMYDIINADPITLANWYNGLTFPISLKDFRDSFFTEVGITQETTTLINDDFMIAKVDGVEKLTGKQVITSICELSGVFGNISRENKFRYVSLSEYISGLYPSDTLYPDDEIYPVDAGDTQPIPKSRYSECDYEDFITGYISKLNVLDDENNVAYTVGTGNNIYNITNNMLLYQDSEDIEEYVDRLYQKIRKVNYRPFTAKVSGNPCLEVGDAVKIHTRKQIVESYVLNRVISGGQMLFDNMESKGVYRYTDNSNSLREQVNQVSGRITSVSRDLTSLDESTTSRFEQTAESIALKVSKGDVSSEISQEAGAISISADRLTIQSTYWDVNADGSQAIKNEQGNTQVLINQNGITLSNGAKLVNGNGVATNYSFQSGSMPVTIGLQGYGSTYSKLGITILAFIPPTTEYTISKATLSLVTNATSWTSLSGTTNFSGYPRNIKAYIGTALPYQVATVLGEYSWTNTTIASGTQIISGGFTSGGFNGASTIGTSKTTTTNDIKSLLTPGKLNVINIYPASASASDEDNAATKTGSGIAVLNIMGYSKIA